MAAPFLKGLWLLLILTISTKAPTAAEKIPAARGTKSVFGSVIPGMMRKMPAARQKMLMAFL